MIVCLHVKEKKNRNTVSSESRESEEDAYLICVYVLDLVQ